MSAPHESQPLEHRSFRLPRGLLARLRDRTRATGASQTALVERYLDEGLRMEEHPLIVFRGGALGRRAMLAGTRLDVGQVVETVRTEDGSVEAAARYLDIGDHLVRACVGYYAEYQAEVDAYAERVSAENERLRLVSERERTLLTG